LTRGVSPPEEVELVLELDELEDVELVAVVELELELDDELDVDELEDDELELGNVMLVAVRNTVSVIVVNPETIQRSPESMEIATMEPSFRAA
jgi:hypothetical protein